jgi:hypothetical protein
MSAITQDVIDKPGSGKKRRKSARALRKLRNALARRKLEEMHEEEILKEQIYDVFEDSEDAE